MKRINVTFQLARSRRRGFTIIELLVAIALVILLLSLVVIVINVAGRKAQVARTTTLMNSMKQALVRFRDDAGYYPPVLGPDGDRLRDLYLPPAQTLAPNDYRLAVQDWWSSCALADYLIGWDEGRYDGYGAGPNSSHSASETPRLGIRSPGDDGVWGATVYTGMPPADLGALARRNPPDTGARLGPYLELKDERLIAAVAYVGGELRTFFPGDQLPVGQTWDSMPKAIVDYWGMPIRYYRRPYPPGALKQSFRARPDNPSFIAPTLSDVFVLRPQVILPGAESVNRFTDAPPAGVPSNNISTRDLDAAEFAMLSGGPDRRIFQNAIFHEENADNIVEVGP